MSTELSEKLSLLVKYQLPDFVRDNYETFQAFLIAYYEFLEQDTEAQYNIQKAKSFADIDNTIDSFVDYFLKQYAYNLPESVFVNQQVQTTPLTDDTLESKRALAKHLIKYHSHKGSESAIKLLFRLLFDEEITFYYPKEDIFKPSESEWVTKKTIKVINNVNVTNYSDTIDSSVIGSVSGASAIVKDIETKGNAFYSFNKKLYEIEIDSDSIRGEFIPNELVYFRVGNTTSGDYDIIGEGNILPVISSIVIDESGTGHTANDIVYVSANVFFYENPDGIKIKQTIVDQESYLGQGRLYFGWNLAVDGDYLVVGYPGDNGTVANANIGSAFVYKKTGNIYGQYAYQHQVNNPSPNSTPSLDYFGTAVVLDVPNNLYVVASPGEDWAGTNQSAFFTYNLTTGALIKQFSANNSSSETYLGLDGDLYNATVATSSWGGRKIDIHNGNLIVTSSQTISVLGRSNAYIITANTGTRVRTLSYTPLLSSNTRSVAIYNNLAFFGGNVFYVSNGSVVYDISTSAGIDYHWAKLNDRYLITSNILAGNNGQIYVFESNNGNLVKTINNPYPGRGYFGRRFDILGNLFVASVTSSNITTSSQLPTNHDILFYDITDGWDLKANISNPNPAALVSAGDRFGYAVGLTNDYIIVGASRQQSDPAVTQGGAVYVFNILDQNNLFQGKVSRISAIGGVKEIEIIDSGNFETFISGSLRSSITDPLLKKTGKYDSKDPLVTVSIKDSTGNALLHGLKTSDKVKLQFTSGNITGSSTYNFSNATTNVLLLDSAKIFTVDYPPGYVDAPKGAGNVILLPLKANLTPSIGTITTYKGTYNSKASHVNDIKKLQDSDYYQEYSYVIRATQSSYLWADIIKKTLHPAGYKLFAEVYISVANSISAVSVVPDNPIYTTILTFLKLLATDPPVVVTSTVTNLVDLNILTQASRNTRYRIGPTYNTLEQFKFKYNNLRLYDLSNILVNYIGNNINEPSIFAPPNEILRGNANIILNSTFNSSSNWTLGSGFSISNGNLVATAASANVIQGFTTAGNVKCMATYEVKSVSAGSITLNANNFSGTVRTTIGNYSEIFFVNNLTSNIILTGLGFTGNVDNVHVKVLEPLTS
jgi:hypothetical protein